MLTLALQLPMKLTDKPTIYCLIDPRTNKIRYVGKADDPDDRLKHHLRERETTHKAKWIVSLKKRGLQPRLAILEEVRPGAWKEREQFWIAYLREQGCDLTNLTKGGDGTIGFRHSEKTKARLSEAKRGIPSWNKGIPWGEDAKRKMSESRKGKPCPAVARANSERQWKPESIEKMRQTLLGRKATAEHSRKQSLGLKKYWANLSSEERETRIVAAGEGLRRQVARVRAGE